MLIMDTIEIQAPVFFKECLMTLNYVVEFGEQQFLFQGRSIPY